MKVRVTEVEKAAWESQASAVGVSLSELVRSRMGVPVVAEAEDRVFVGDLIGVCTHGLPAYVFCKRCSEGV